jgi:hypothetical protein
MIFLLMLHLNPFQTFRDEKILLFEDLKVIPEVKRKKEGDSILGLSEGEGSGAKTRRMSRSARVYLNHAHTACLMSSFFVYRSPDLDPVSCFRSSAVPNLTGLDVCKPVTHRCIECRETWRSQH